MSKKENFSASQSQEAKGKRSDYDPALLKKLIDEGHNAKELCELLGIKHRQVLRSHVLKLMATQKIYVEVPGLFEKRTRQAYCNRQGEIRFCMKNIDFKGMELVPDETEFTVFVENNTITLQKIVHGNGSATNDPTSAAGETYTETPPQGE